MSPAGESRGHDALRLLEALLIDLDKAPPIVRLTIAMHPAAAAHLALARWLVIDALDPVLRLPPRSSAPGYCGYCDAIHLPTDPPEAPPAEPEAHGRRRTG